MRVRVTSPTTILKHAHDLDNDNDSASIEVPAKLEIGSCAEPETLHMPQGSKVRNANGNRSMSAEVLRKTERRSVGTAKLKDFSYTKPTAHAAAAAGGPVRATYTVQLPLYVKQQHAWV